MKKIVTVLLVFVMLLFSSCGGKESNKNDVKVSLVIGISGVDDKSFNQNTWEGIKRYAADKGLPDANIAYKHSVTEQEYVDNLSIFSDEHPDLIVAPGYYFVNPIKFVSSKYPRQKYLIMDKAIDEKRDNVLSITFAAQESSYLAGIAAALKSKELGAKKVGMICGDDVNLHNFEAGFEAGVRRISKKIKVITRFSYEFSNPIKGAKMASDMYDDGVAVVFNVAGSTGNGIIKEAKERAAKGEDVWVVGVDKDQYEEGMYNNDNSVILTSVLKNLDVAVYDTIEKVVKDEFESGHIIYSLKNNGVGLPKENPNLKPKWIKKIDKYRDAIIKGKIKVPAKPRRLKKKAVK